MVSVILRNFYSYPASHNTYKCCSLFNKNSYQFNRHLHWAEAFDFARTVFGWPPHQQWCGAYRRQGTGSRGRTTVTKRKTHGRGSPSVASARCETRPQHEALDEIR